MRKLISPCLPPWRASCADFAAVSNDSQSICRRNNTDLQRTSAPDLDGRNQSAKLQGSSLMELYEIRAWEEIAESGDQL